MRIKIRFATTLVITIFAILMFFVPQYTYGQRLGVNFANYRGDKRHGFMSQYNVYLEYHRTITTWLTDSQLHHFPAGTPVRAISRHLLTDYKNQGLETVRVFLQLGEYSTIEPYQSGEQIKWRIIPQVKINLTDLCNDIASKDVDVVFSFGYQGKSVHTNPDFIGWDAVRDCIRDAFDAVVLKSNVSILEFDLENELKPAPNSVLIDELYLFARSLFIDAGLSSDVGRVLFSLSFDAEDDIALHSDWFWTDRGYPRSCQNLHELYDYLYEQNLPLPWIIDLHVYPAQGAASHWDHTAFEIGSAALQQLYWWCLNNGRSEPINFGEAPNGVDYWETINGQAYNLAEEFRDAIRNSDLYRELGNPWTVIAWAGQIPGNRLGSIPSDIWIYNKGGSR